jgi:hypothetical protein
MKEIGLTKGQVAIVDDEDYERIGAHKWCADWHPNTQSFYAMRKPKIANGKQLTVRMHREVMAAKAGEQVDHINHDTLDNRRENLRLCTGGQNQANHRMQVNNTSGFKGVDWLKERGKWRAYLTFNSKQRHIGLFQTALEAALAYDDAARETFGEFALTNEKLGLIDNTEQSKSIRIEV